MQRTAPDRPLDVEAIWTQTRASRERAQRLRERVAELHARALATRRGARLLRLEAARRSGEMEQAAHRRDAALQRRPGPWIAPTPGPPGVAGRPGRGGGDGAAQPGETEPARVVRRAAGGT